MLAELLDDGFVVCLVICLCTKESALWGTTRELKSSLDCAISCLLYWVP